MFIENSPRLFDFIDPFATHPSLDARIRVLERLSGMVPASALPGRPIAPGWTSGLLLAASLGYAFLLLFMNSTNPNLVNAVAVEFAPVTDPLASFIPIALLADHVANPVLGISAALIRHLFPMLVLINTPFGLIALSYWRSLSEFHAHRIARSAIALLIGVYAGGAILSLYILFWGPAIRLALTWPLQPMDLAGLLFGSISPALFFLCL